MLLSLTNDFVAYVVISHRLFLFITMLFMEKDKVLIKHYRLKRKYGRKQLLKEFLEKKLSELGRESYWTRSMIQETKKKKTRPRKTTDVLITCKYWHCWQPNFESGEWPWYPFKPKRNWDGNRNSTSICSSDWEIQLRFSNFQTNKYTTVN